MARLFRANIVRRLSVLGMVVAAASLYSSASFAQASSVKATDRQLGAAWPNVKDVSLLPGFHVYRFDLDEVKYIQVNDLSGDVLAVFATSGGEFLRLPIGSARTFTPRHRLAGSAIALGPDIKVYDDGAVQITVTTASNGDVSLAAACGASCGNNHAQ